MADATLPPLKVCSKCGAEKPATLEFFFASKRARDGLYGSCKDCRREYEATDAGRAKSNSRKRQWTARNPEKMAAAQRRHFLENREMHREKNRRYDAKRREQKQAYYAARKPVIGARNKAWRDANPDIRKEYKLKREARTARATPPWVDAAHWAEIRRVYADARRVTRETGEPHHVDHIVPLQGRDVCGLHVVWNLRVIPATENLRKNRNLAGVV